MKIPFEALNTERTDAKENSLFYWDIRVALNGQEDFNTSFGVRSIRTTSVEVNGVHGECSFHKKKNLSFYWAVHYSLACPDTQLLMMFGNCQVLLTKKQAEEIN